MTSFIEDVIVDLLKKKIDVSQLTVILPSKRAGVFFKHYLAKTLKATLFSPQIMSIEEFIEDISDLQYCSNTESLFEFYSAYINCTPKNDIESFEVFSKWAQLLLQDFNEIDRYLISSDHIFDYLKSIKELDHWSLASETTESVKNYLVFWTRLKTYYHNFKELLYLKQKGYQGMVYRDAVDNIEHYVGLNPTKKHVFVGFNALNKAEEIIIQELLQLDLATIYWDTDVHFVNNPIHSAGSFMRNHIKNWSYFDSQPFNWIASNYTEEKNVKIIGTPKNIGQVKYIGELIDTIHSDKNRINGIAVVLGDESLLLPLLNSIPEKIDTVNITMGIPLETVPLTSLFKVLFRIHKNHSSSFYYKDIVLILSHQFIKPLFLIDTINYSDIILNHIQINNIVSITFENLKSWAKDKAHLIELLFTSWENNSDNAIEQCSRLIYTIKDSLSIEKSKNILSLEYLYRFNEIFNELRILNATYQHIKSNNTLFLLFKELLKSESLDFKGEPVKGLQIMGMLETRVLDFETVIISSVNEGILPAGKSNNSFIPFDLKLENGLPTFREKDAIYTYHFYRLLQRAKNIYIIYNTEPDVLNGGEKSRFITQLEIEKLHPLTHDIVSPHVPTILPVVKVIKKTSDILIRLKEIAEKGFSPSSLTNYIRNPIDFYYEKVLQIQKSDGVEETVAANTLGTVIHETLEDLFKPVLNQILTEGLLKKMFEEIDVVVAKHFKSHYKEGDITKGKNLIIFEIAKRYVNNFLSKELETVQSGNEIKIIALEKKVKVPIQIHPLEFPIYLTGSVDRIDTFNGQTRIIDYKTGKVEQNKVEIVNWEAILSDYDAYSKSFQVLTYAYMLNEIQPFTGDIEAGIISFKNLQGDYFLKFSKKDKQGRGAIKDSNISQDTLNQFSIQLKQLILDICNPDIDFIEKIIN